MRLKNTVNRGSMFFLLIHKEINTIRGIVHHEYHHHNKYEWIAIFACSFLTSFPQFDDTPDFVKHG